MLRHTVKRLHHLHFAFLRAGLQGIDLAQAWTRYMPSEGRADLRVVKRSYRELRDQVAIEAARNGRPGIARLLATETQQATVPTLEEFSASQGLSEFSYQTQLEYYQDAFGKPSRSQRLLGRQLIALKWVEDRSAQDPQPSDRLAWWFPPRIAVLLERAGLHTLQELATRMNAAGSTWSSAVPGVGMGKADCIERWMRAHGSALLMPRHLPSTATKPVTDAGLRVSFDSLTAFDGSQGRFRAHADSTLDADNDWQAVQSWLSTKTNTNTRQAYEKELKRLVAWSILEAEKPLSSLTQVDALAYLAFLDHPSTAWCAPAQDGWRPFKGPLSSGSKKLALTAVQACLAYLQRHGYLRANAFADLNVAATPSAFGSVRALNDEDLSALVDVSEERADSLLTARQARAIQWLSATGLRNSEMCAAQIGDLSWVTAKHRGQAVSGWMLRVVGKGSKTRMVPIPERCVSQLRVDLERLSPPRALDAAQVQCWPILFKSGADGLTRSGLYRLIKSTAKRASAYAGQNSRLRKASPHWLRHTFATRAIANDMPVQVVQNNLGHASLSTLAVYVRAEEAAALQAMQELEKAGHPA